jgi:hypothetical protein
MDFLVLPFVEIEIRFGYLNNSKNNNNEKFDSGIDKKYFFKIIEMLSATEPGNEYEFIKIENKNTTEYFNGNNKLKLIENDESKEKVLISKENVLTKNMIIKNAPFDIRLSVNQEINYNSEIKDSLQLFDITNSKNYRKKTRKSFISKHYRYDLTEVIEVINNVHKEKFEIEIELIVNNDNLKWNNQYINEFLECKVYDLFNIVEPVERSLFKLSLFSN